MDDALDVLVFYVPVADTDAVLDALFAVGAGEVGRYRECAFVAPGVGQFRPLPGSSPTIGTTDELELVAENRVELTFRRELRGRVVQTLREAHPYETPAFHVLRNVADEA